MSTLARFVGPAWRRLPRFVRSARYFRNLRDRAVGVRVVRTRDEIDAELARLDGASYEEQKKIFASFRMSVDRSLELEPASDAYRDRELALYRFISGKDYDPANDVTTFDVEAAAKRPFPYFTDDARAVGQHLMAVGHVLETMALPVGSSVLEFGPGWGNLTVAMARTGYDVTAVDIAPDFLALIAKRAAQEGCSVDLMRGDFFIRLDRRFDAVVFFESFHHCADHVALVRRLDELVAPGGKVVFAAEPITDDFDVPWGVRLDGESLWAMRRNGWFETGFREDYFRDLLRSHGWKLTKRVLRDNPWGVVLSGVRV